MTLLDKLLVCFIKKKSEPVQPIVDHLAPVDHLAGLGGQPAKKKVKKKKVKKSKKKVKLVYVPGEADDASNYSGPSNDFLATGP